MNAKASDSSRKKASADPNSQVYVIDIVRYLSSLAQLHSLGETGNPRLSDGLAKLADALRPYYDHPISELAAIIHPSTSRVSSPIMADPETRLALPLEAEATGYNEVERILNDERYSKEQLVDLGARRFGISRSKLTRLRKHEAVEAIRAALSHVKSLDAIADEARRAGFFRTS